MKPVAVKRREVPLSENDKDHAGVIFPPPLIYGGFLLIGFVIDFFWPIPVLPDIDQYAVGGVLLVLALAIVIPALILFRKGGTAVRPDRPTTAIITGGPFRFTRNPFYLALTVLYAGIAIVADSVWVMGLLLPVLLIMNRGVIDREEKYLDGKFGEEYRRYKETVRRWL